MVTVTIKPKQLIEDIVLKQSISQPLFAQSHVLSKETMKDALKFKPPRKLHECTTCTDNSTHWMVSKEENCETTGLVPEKCHQSNFWKKKFCQLSCFKANYGYQGDECCDNQTPGPYNIFTNE